MSRRYLFVNVVLGIVSVVFAAGIVRTFIVRRALPAPAEARGAPAPPPAAAPVSALPALSAYGVIAARNLFSPSRSEISTASTPAGRPILHGVVIDGAKSRAFLEEPPAKRVSGYSVGDTVGGGRLQQISDDKVVIARPEGPLEILLQDPSKPRATPVSAGPGPQQPPPTVQPPAGAVAPPGTLTSPPTPPQPLRRRQAVPRPDDG